MNVADPETRPRDHRFFAGRAIRILAGMPRDVPEINELQSFLEGRVPGRFQGRNRRRREILDEVKRLESGKMKGDISAHFVLDR
jgi:hypothetical protein